MPSEPGIPAAPVGAPLAFTMGDAAGIGPELIARLFAEGLPHPAVVYGDEGALRRACAALGLAGSFAGGLFEFLADGSDVKRLHPGKAARDGVVCAELASRGITGPKTVLEGRDGYFAAHAVRGWQAQALDPGRHARGEWAMLGTYFKLYPCCRHAHAAVDAALAIRRQLGSGIGDIRRIVIRTYAVAARHDGVRERHALRARRSRQTPAQEEGRDGPPRPRRRPAAREVHAAGREAR
ncbi:MAG: MmgE/PrpD family protein [Myxococcales bacterium]|nr:MmgE/PrpD family protein [Myxococcales bacterium]